jgi:hypothetical protein
MDKNKGHEGGKYYQHHTCKYYQQYLETNLVGLVTKQKCNNYKTNRNTPQTINKKTCGQLQWG